MKKLYIDTETTGLDSTKNGIISLAYIIEDQDGEELARGMYTMNTFMYANSYSPQALEINGYTVDQIKSFQDPRDALLEFDKTLTLHSEGDRYQIVAYNAQFDKGMLETLYNKHLPNRFWKVITHKVIDSLQMVIIFQDAGIIDTGKSQNLESATKFFNIDYIPHNCVSDNDAQHAIYKLLNTKLREGLIPWIN